MNTTEMIIEYLNEAAQIYFKGRESYFANSEITFIEAEKKGTREERASMIEIAKMLQLEDHRIEKERYEAQRI